MKNYFRDDFWDLFQKLPPFAKEQVNRVFDHLALDTRYPSLQSKCVNKQKARYSIRINKKGYHALGHIVDGDMYWYWIGGDHDEYEREIRR